MEVAVAVAGIIRQQACSLGVWCPEEEGEEEEEEVPVGPILTSHGGWCSLKVFPYHSCH